MRRTITGAAVAALSLAGLVAAAPAAQANIQATYQGNDVGWAAHGYTVNSGGNQEHRDIHVDDRECDGHQAYVQYYLAGSKSTLRTVVDQDGCGGYNYHVNWAAYGTAGRIYVFRVCEANVGCNAWYYPYSHTWA